MALTDGTHSWRDLHPPEEVSSISAINLKLTNLVKKTKSRQNKPAAGSGQQTSCGERSDACPRSGNLCFILLICLFANGMAFGANPGPIPKLDKSVEEFMEKHEVPGLSLAIARNGRLVYAKGYGFADREAEEPVTTESRFRIASLSKPITAVAIMKLVEDGKLSLNQKVFGPAGILGPRYGMENPDHPVTKISILNLLQHSSGGWSNAPGDPMFSNVSLSADELLVWTLRNRPLDNAPGTAYAYSNFGYFVLARVIEEVIGESYEDYVKSEILLPMGITSMEIGGNSLADKRPREVRYYPHDRYDPYQYNVARMDAHGGWISSATDLVRFLVQVDGFNTRRNFLRQQTIRNMTTPSRVNADYACGWSVNEAGNWWHVGLLPGTRALMVRSSGEFNWAILTNRRGPDGNDIEEDFDLIVWKAINDSSIRWPNADLF